MDKPLPEYNLDPPEDPPECPECDAVLISNGDVRQPSSFWCAECGWEPDEPDYTLEDK